MDLQLPGCWTDKRKELRSWFARNAPSLGELYEGAVYMVSADEFPGRVRFVAHAVREIRNRLPDVIAGPRAGGTFQWKNRLDELMRIWTHARLPTDGSLPIKVNEGESLPSSQEVPIPCRVFLEVARLIRDHDASRERPSDAAKRLFEAIDPNNSESEAMLRPRIEQWIKVTEWFVERVHDRGALDAEMGAQELRERFEAFEAALGAMVRGFFKTLEELDAILEDANSRASR